MSLNYSIDSLKIRIPYKAVNILNDELLGHWVDAKINKETGELIYVDDSKPECEKTFKRLSYNIEHNGIKTKYLVEKLSNGKTVDLFVCILLNSKLLKEDYFKGISPETIDKIYNELMAHNVVSFNRELLEFSFISDVDIKLDFLHCDPAHLLKHLKSCTKSSNKFGFGARVENKKDMQGIVWGDRKKANFSCPFVKIYNKNIEAAYNSSEFFTTYNPISPLQSELITDLVPVSKGNTHKLITKKSKYLSNDELNSISQESSSISKELNEVVNKLNFIKALEKQKRRLLRLEFTIKSHLYLKKIYTSLGTLETVNPQMTLKWFFSLSKVEYDIILRILLYKHLNLVKPKKKKRSKKMDKLPADLVLKNLISVMLQNGISDINILTAALDGFIEPVSKSRWKKKILSILEEQQNLESGQLEKEGIEDTINFLENLGLV